VGRAALYVSSASKRLRLGGGSVIGGRVGLMLDRNLLGELAQGRTVSLVSGTNGKTTTTRLLAAALGGFSRVATSVAGANMPSGLVTALADSAPEAPAVLEVDEGHLANVADAVQPVVVALLNLSRDQLDRMSEVRMVAARWRAALVGRDRTVVVANADDPLVTWAAYGAPRIAWVAAGQLWHADAVGCPACEGRIVFADGDGREGGDWWCTCGFCRPEPGSWLEGDELVMSDGRALALRLQLPGRCNRANAAMAVQCASVLGVDTAQALAAMATVGDVEGRFATVGYEGGTVRLLLAKNPAGWTELLDLLREHAAPAVIGINARVADGRDPSWLWDVPFERLAGRLVVATGERCRDLAVRLRHAGVEHLVVRDQLEALGAACSQQVDYVGNYTAFQQLRRALGRTARSRFDGLPRHSASVAVKVPSGVATSATPSGHERGRRDDEAPAEEQTSKAPAGVVPQAAQARSSRGAGDGSSALRVVVVHPDLLGTYGDGGNGLVLADRAAWRGIEVELVMALSDTALPAGGDLYCLGGGEDGPQVQSAQLLADGTLQRAVEAGAAVLAVCAGYQVVGQSFPDALGTKRSGVGLLDVSTVKGRSKRAVGELLAEPFELRGPWSSRACDLADPGVRDLADPGAYDLTGRSERDLAGRSERDLTAGGKGQARGPRLERLTGFENHGGVTRLGAGVHPLARVLVGIGNGTGDRSEGAVSGRVIGTYLHGPVLARNPSFADLLLTMVTGMPLAPLDDTEEEALRAERLAVSRIGNWRAGVGRGVTGAGETLRHLVKLRRV
jgi:CobQ-like glutamine amidotransferase family enzyme/UDP-N-acetylmuramyl tripeptide synthase